VVRFGVMKNGKSLRPFFDHGTVMYRPRVVS
jgi:hypothetical protein